MKRGENSEAVSRGLAITGRTIGPAEKNRPVEPHRVPVAAS